MIRISKKDIVLVFLYLSYGVILFAFVIYFRFPYDLLKNHIIRQASSAIGKDIHIKKVSPFFPLGVQFDNVSVTDKQSLKGEPFLYASKIKIEAEPASIFTPDKKASILINAYGGQIRITGEGTLQGIDAKVVFTGLDSSSFPFEKLKIKSHPVKARLSGKADINLVMSGKKIKKCNLIFTLDRGTIKDIKLYGFSIPPIHYNTASLEGNFDKGIVNIKDAVISAKEGEGSLKGSITLSKNIMESTINLTIAFRFSSAYMKKLGIPAAILGRKKDSKGFSNVTVKGNLKMPRVRF